MRETELKSVVDDPARRRSRIEQAGGRLVFEGRLEDRRYDTPGRTLGERDEVLRLRIYRDEEGARAGLDFKGPTGYEGGYKVRDELTTSVADPDAMVAILERLGYVVTRAIDRTIVQYDLAGTIIRFEHYPRMDPLVEVEGTPEGIEHAIVALGLPREGFTTDRLPGFVARFEQRTGERAALCDGELDGSVSYLAEDA